MRTLVTFEEIIISSLRSIVSVSLDCQDLIWDDVRRGRDVSSERNSIVLEYHHTPLQYIDVKWEYLGEIGLISEIQGNFDPETIYSESFVSVCG